MSTYCPPCRRWRDVTVDGITVTDDAVVTALPCGHGDRTRPASAHVRLLWAAHGAATALTTGGL